MDNAITNAGELAQNAIDNFIELWLIGAKEIFGSDDVPPETYAPVPFYSVGAGYWNNGMWNMSATQTGGISPARCEWAVWTEGEPSELKIDLKTTAVNIPSRPVEWNNEAASYWSNERNIDIEVNKNYIISNEVDYIGYYFSGVTNNNPSCICGFKNTLGVADRFTDLALTTVYKYDGTEIAAANKLRIIQNNQAIQPSNDVYRGIDIVSQGYLNLPRTSDSYWFTVMPDIGDNIYNDNFYDMIENHNTTNNYYTDEYNNTYNEYHIDLPSGLGFDIGVGPLGVGIGVAPVVGVNPSINFDDLLDILTPIVDDLNDNAGYNTEIVIHDYEYYLYKDMGDFFITPLHQYDKIPVAPSFDGTIDLADYPTVLAEGANTFLNFMPATLSALFTAAFVACVIIKKLGR